MEKPVVIKDIKSEHDVEKLNMMKQRKKKRSLKAARLIVRNLPFKASEKTVNEHFSLYGNVLEVVLLRRQNKLVGCGFVQYDNKVSAAKAIAKTSGKSFLGRPIIVDWALSKDKYASKHKVEAIKKETDSTIKEESIDHDSDEEHVSLVNEIVSKSSRESSTDNEVKQISKENLASKLPINRDNVTDYERTLFIKNVPFSANNDDLRSCVECFGEVCYALICFDPLTEHSRGTAFVKFKDKESAERCLNAGTDFKLHDTILDPHLAIPKDKLPTKEEKKPKDNRNLYLAKEGVIIAGTPAASGVSASDISKRLSLEHWKSQKLRNFNMFVSKTRLVVHNLPQNCDDKKLFNIFKNKGPANTAPIKAKVMRNLKDVDSNGIGGSKGFGFVDFKNHDDALTCLRKVNNNPHIFSKSMRPIVSFAIENNSALMAKGQRNKVKNTEGNVLPGIKYHSTSLERPTAMDKGREQFVGINANEGNTKMFTKETLKKHAVLHIKKLKQEKASRNSLKKKPKRMRKIEGKSSFKNIETEDNFSKLVEKYKMKIDENKKKWYE